MDETRRPRFWTFFARGAALLIAVTAAVLVWRFAFTNGLITRYYRTTTWSGFPTVVAVEDEVSSPVFQRGSGAVFPTGAFGATYRGFLLVQQPGRYTFSLTSDDGSWLFLDDRLVVENGGIHQSEEVTSTTYLDAGLHAIEVRYFNGGGERALELRWGRERQPLEVVPSWALFPTRISYGTLSATRRAGYLLPLFWAALLLALPIAWAWRSIARHLRRFRGERGTNASLLAVLALTLGLAVPGIAWGLPDFRAWAPDELVPYEVVDGLREGFSNGWFSTYPPLHYGLLGVLLLPFELLARAGLTNLWHSQTYLLIFLLMRTLSVGMALGTVYLVYLCGLELHRTRTAGVFSALIVASMPPFLFYSKLANVDVPYVFWLTLSLLYYIRFLRDTRAAHLVGFAVAGMLAVCTKDQAYAFYVLPAVYAFWLRHRAIAVAGPLSRLTDPGLVGAAAAGLLTFAVGQNLLFNVSGFLDHLRFIVENSTYPPIYAPSVGGHVALVKDAMGQLVWSMGWPAFIASVLGVVAVSRQQPRLLLGLALVVASYYVFFIAVIRYFFDRFFLGVCVILALFGGRALVDLVGAGRFRLARRLAGAAIVGYGVLYGSAVPAVMVADSRYTVESWVRSHVPPGATIGMVGPLEYLPRFPQYTTVQVPQSWSDMMELMSELTLDVLVINVGYSCRARPGTEPHEFYARLNDGDNGVYQRAFSHRSDPWWPVLGPESVYRAPCENTVTNLGKINPEIRVFRRIVPDAP